MTLQRDSRQQQSGTRREASQPIFTRTSRRGTTRNVSIRRRCTKNIDCRADRAGRGRLFGRISS